MAEEDKDSKTEMPTPQKIEDARKKGQVAFSREVGSVVIVFGGALAFLAFGRSLAKGVIELTEIAYHRIAQPNAPLGDLVMDLALLVGIPLAGIMIFLGLLLFAASFARWGRWWREATARHQQAQPDQKSQTDVLQRSRVRRFRRCSRSPGSALWGISCSGADFMSYRRPFDAPGGRSGGRRDRLVSGLPSLPCSQHATIDVFMCAKYTRPAMSLRDIRDETKGRGL